MTTNNGQAIARQIDEQRGVTIADPEAAAGALAHVLGTGDLSQLSNEERVAHYLRLCRSLGLNPLSRPFQWIEFYDPQTKGKRLTLYPDRSCAEQLRRQHQISVRVVRREQVGGLFVVEVEGHTPGGRVGTASKYVPVTYTDQGGTTRPLAGQQLANAYMKAETGALRRLTFSMVGLASPPEMEELARPKVVTVDAHGRVLENPTDEQRYLAEQPRAARAIGEPVFEDMDVPDFDGPSQAVRPDELETPKREGPPPTFRASDEDVERWQARWFANVRGLSLDSDEARHAFVAAWTRDELEWPKAKQTDSLATFFRRATNDEAEAFLQHVWALMDDEKRAALEDVDAALEGSTRSRSARSKVADSVALTGGPEAPAF